MKKILVIIFTILICITAFSKIKNTEPQKTIKFASWGSQSETKILKELLQDFEKNNKINVEFIHIPENYFQKIHMLFASNLAPDVIFTNNHHLKMYTDANLLEDLTQYIKNKEDFYSISLDCLSDNGKIYAIPRDISNLVLYVNKDALKEAKIEYKKKIETLDELKEIATKLTNDKRFGINFEENSLYWLYYLGANGGGIISDDLKKIIINTKKSSEALKLYADFANKYNIAPTKAQIGSMTTAQMFINQKIAMYLGGRWMVPKFRETITFDWDIVEFPSSIENKVFVDASGWAITKQSKQKENALKLILFLSSYESINRLAESGLIIPARIKSANKYMLKEKNKKPNNSDIFLTMLENAKPTPTNKNYSEINDILKERIKNMLSGKNNVEDVIDKKIIRKVESLL